MSDDNKLEEIRKRKLAEIQKQAMQQNIADHQQKAFEEKKYSLMRKVLSQEGRQRLENIRMVKPEFAEQIELQLIQLLNMGKIRGQLSDKAFKNLLEQISKSNKKKDFNIKNF
ncbi:MAG: DNA-binding protein [Candidatus Lokiarchaeota archaeon]|nr:DNA-binding protein [Candidatus Lokiarchaeota archaeon]